MVSPGILESQQSVQAPRAGRTAAGCWKLTAGTALSLHPRQRGVLEVAQGRVWLTASGSADYVLLAGERWVVEAGQHVVLEAWSPAGAASEPVAFRWDVAAAPLAAAEWEQGVAQPLRDLLQAVADALAAGGRLAAGLGRFVLHRMAPPRPGRAV